VVTRPATETLTNGVCQPAFEVLATGGAGGAFSSAVAAFRSGRRKAGRLLPVGVDTLAAKVGLSAARGPLRSTRGVASAASAAGAEGGTMSLQDLSTSSGLGCGS
jgi:hypothetical protein